MTKKAWRLISGPILVMGLSAPWIMNCGAAPGGASMPGGLSDLGGGGALANCPDTASVDGIAKYDFVQNFKMEAEGAAKLKAGLESAIEIKAFSDKVDADLRVACGNLSKDLGGASSFATGNEACKAAMKAMAGVKGKMGAGVRLALEIKPPTCQASMNVMADCAAKCDVRVKPAQAKIECEPGKLSGTCEGECSGECDMKAAAKCAGSCSGSCDAQMKGTCGGKCNGKCDGKISNGATCTGTCDGKCDGNVEGQCSGQCGGSCKMNAAAKCNGTCTGGCKGEFKEPKCAGDIKPPEMNADCKAKCNAEVQAKAECTPAAVGIKIEGAADLKAAEMYKLAIEKDLPGVLKVAIGIGERGTKVAGEVTTAVDGLQSSLKTMVKGDALLGAKLVGCVASPFKAAIDAAASLRANISVSVDVKASASASGSASGHAG